jgi:polyisoprenoid-binding protein YceI
MPDVIEALMDQISTEPTTITPGFYKVDPEHTRILFSVSHFGISKYFGEMPGASGSLTIDPQRPEQSALDVSAPTDRIATGNATLDAELRSPDWLDASGHPLVRFVSNSVSVDDNRVALVTGELTLHGITRPVVLKATFVGAGINPVKGIYTIGFDVRGKIRRSDFGIMSHLPGIGDQLDLMISGAFELQA